MKMSEKTKAQEAFKIAKAEGRKILTEYESKKILQAYGIPVTVAEIAANIDEAGAMASKVGFPVVLKIHSPDITHKSDVGGVKVNLKNSDDVRKAFNEIITSAKKHKPDAKIEGVLVQNMAPSGREIIVGVTKDRQFGPLVMFGLGGIFVEVLKDVSFRLPPISKNEAMKMMAEIKGYPILKGVRGSEPADLDSVADIIAKTSKMVMEIPEISELDMNPIFVYNKGLMVVDARIVM
jgi:acetyl-CoA synthetase (ADP-forming)